MVGVEYKGPGSGSCGGESYAEWRSIIWRRDDRKREEVDLLISSESRAHYFCPQAGHSVPFSASFYVDLLFLIFNKQVQGAASQRRSL
jgi:hypothetical protein